MKDLAKYMYDFSEIDTKRFSELPLAIKFGSKENYQPIMDEMRNHLLDIYKAAVSANELFQVARDIQNLVEPKFDELRAIPDMSQEEAEKAVKEINQIIKLSKVQFRAQLLFEKREENKLTSESASMLVNEAFDVVLQAKSGKEVIALGNDRPNAIVVNTTLTAAAEVLGMSTYGIKEGNVLKSNMNGDDIKFAYYAIASLSDKLGGKIVPSDKKEWIIEAAKKEVAELHSEETGALDFFTREFCASDLSEDYDDAMSEAKRIQKEVPKLISVLTLASLPSDVLYDPSYNNGISDAIRGLDEVANLTYGVENKANHLENIRDDLVLEFRSHDIELPYKFKVYNPEETDWIIRYTDEGTDLFNEVNSTIQNAEGEQRCFEEELRSIETILDKDLKSEIERSLQGLDQELRTHRSAKRAGEYNM